MKMNRNMMIGGVIAIIVVIVVVVVFVMGGDDEDENGVTADALTSAFEELLAGNAEPAKALACEGDHANIDEAAAAMSALADAEVETSASCTIDGDTATCDLTIAGETNSLSSPIVDGQVCGGFDFGGGEPPADEEETEG